MGCYYLPNIVKYRGEEWFSMCGHEYNYWFVCYSKYVNSHKTKEFMEVRSSSRYFCYLKMLYKLWKIRDKVNFGIEV